jgi:hypothetical protein
LRTAVVKQCQTRCDQAIAGNDWDTALRAASSAGVLDARTSAWISDVIRRYPGGPTAVPRDLLARLPASTLPDELLRSLMNGVWEITGAEILGEYRALSEQERAEAKAKDYFLRIFPDGRLSMGPESSGKLVESRLRLKGNVEMTNGNSGTLTYDGKVLCLDDRQGHKYYFTKVK